MASFPSLSSTQQAIGKLGATHRPEACRMARDQGWLQAHSLLLGRARQAEIVRSQDSADD